MAGAHSAAWWSLHGCGRAVKVVLQWWQHSPAGHRPPRPPVALVIQLPRDTSQLCALAGVPGCCREGQGRLGLGELLVSYSPGEELGAKVGWIRTRKVLPSQFESCRVCGHGFGALARNAPLPGFSSLCCAPACSSSPADGATTQ